MEVADEIFVMNKGRVEQVGTPAEIYDNPATPFVMSFIGPVNVLSSHVDIIPDTSAVSPSEKVFLRPHDILIGKNADDHTSSAIVNRITHLGWEIRVELVLRSGEILNAHLSREQFYQLQLEKGQRVYIKPKQTKIFATSNGLR
jgi:sulfate transport system ATP-binding protein